MNKKGIMLAVFSILVFIGFVFGYSMILSNQEKLKRDFEIGSNQFNLIDTYYDSEYDLLNLDQGVRYSSFKAIKEFSDSGGIIKDCNNRWIFNDKCEPDFEKYFLEMFKEKMKEYGRDVKSVDIDENYLIGDVGGFFYEKKLDRMNFTYTINGNFNQSLILNFEELNELKDKIKRCIQDNDDLEKCANGQKNGDIYSFSLDIGKVFYSDRFEDIVLKFEIDIKDSGVITGVI
ncbi:MAG: hypothetical protein V1663_00070 [archaeon]